MAAVPEPQREGSSTGHLHMQRGHGSTAKNHGYGVSSGATPTPNLPSWRGGGNLDAGRHLVNFVIRLFRWSPFHHSVIFVIPPFLTHARDSMAYLASSAWRCGRGTCANIVTTMAIGFTGVMVAPLPSTVGGVRLTPLRPPIEWFVPLPPQTPLVFYRVEIRFGATIRRPH